MSNKNNKNKFEEKTNNNVSKPEVNNNDESVVVETEVSTEETPTAPVE